MLTSECNPMGTPQQQQTAKLLDDGMPLMAFLGICDAIMCSLWDQTDQNVETPLSTLAASKQQHHIKDFSRARNDDVQSSFICWVSKPDNLITWYLVAYPTLVTSRVARHPVTGWTKVMVNMHKPVLSNHSQYYSCVSRKILAHLKVKFLVQN